MGTGSEGGAFRYLGDSFRIYNSTIVDNSAESGGGFWNTDVISFTNTIIANNSGADCFRQGGGTFISNDYNIDGDNSCGLTQTNDWPNTNPMLDTLADNGGPTLTHALLPLSPAVDAGNCSEGITMADQRGVVRPQELGCDIGAFERVVSPFVQAFADTYVALEDIPLNIDGLGVIDNDLSLNPLSASLVTTPSNGLLNLNSDGSFTYLANEDFYGMDSFSYQASDGVLDDTAVVTITIVPLQDAPLTINDVYTTTEDMTLSVAAAGVLQNDSDPENGPLSVVTYTQGLSGSVYVALDGGFVYTPASDFYGYDTFTYRASDGVLTSMGVVTITVLPTPDAPLAMADAYTTTEDVPLSITAPGVLVNDSDADGESLSVISYTQSLSGSVGMGLDGGFVYTPTLNFYGDDTFTYWISDGLLMDRAVVTITIFTALDKPLAVNDHYTTTENVILSVAAPGLLVNDVDDDGAPLSVISYTQSLTGTVYAGLDGSFSYIPDLDFYGNDTFTYWVGNGEFTSQASATIVVLPEPRLYLPIIKRP